VIRYAFAGDRDLSVRVLDWLLERGDAPAALLVSDGPRASHADALARRVAASGVPVLRGAAFREPEGLERLRALDLDLVVGIHFPYLVPQAVLGIPRLGFVNLHPAYLPWNRGWHTPSWALLEGTPAGATLHFMSGEVDAGDVIHQRRLRPSPGDTAHTLYARLKALEFEVFREAWPSIAAGSPPRTPQPPGGTARVRRELLRPEVQRIDPDAPTTAGELLTRLRALTTSEVAEAAYYEAEGRRYRVQVVVTEEARPETEGAAALPGA
jgi:methionyl-tRNA formyltransferase